jgi:hypothetical protein
MAAEGRALAAARQIAGRENHSNHSAFINLPGGYLEENGFSQMAVP